MYCGAPWPDEVLPIDHLPTCPSVTGLWPVRPEDVEPHGFHCAECCAPFVAGDFYVQVALEGEDGHTDPDVVEVLCLSCAAEAAML